MLDRMSREKLIDELKKHAHKGDIDPGIRDIVWPETDAEVTERLKREREREGTRRKSTRAEDHIRRLGRADPELSAGRFATETKSLEKTRKKHE